MARRALWLYLQPVLMMARFAALIGERSSLAWGSRRQPSPAGALP